MTLTMLWARAGGWSGLDRPLATRTAAILAYNLLFLAWLALRPAEGLLAMAVGDLAQCVGPLVALAFCARWRAPGRAGGAPLLVGLGTLCFGLGQAVWSYYELVLRRPLPLPSWSDVCFLAIYPCLLAGLLRLPGRALSPAHRTRVLLDGLLIMVTAAALSWYFLLGPTLLQAAGSPLRTLVSAAYPLGDLVLLSCLLLLAAHTAGGPGGRLLALGLGIIIVTDSAFLRGTLLGTYATGALTDVGWPLGYMLLALAARAIGADTTRKAGGATTAPAASTHPWQAWLPFALVPAAALLAAIAHRTDAGTPLERGVQVGAVALLLLLLLRQAAALLENQRLARALAATNAALAARNRQLAALATVDPLTDLPNHRALHSAIELELERGHRYGQPFALLFLDLDHFKALNDAHGHAAGDASLREFGAVAGRSLRAVDTLGRWGGEEFVALLPHACPDEAAAIAERLRAGIAAHRFGIAGGHLTCSIGVATYPELGADRDALVAAADGAMYAAKRLGRNQVRVAGSPEVIALLDGPDGAAGRDELALSGTVEALAGLVEQRDAYTGRHTDAVGGLALRLALALGCGAPEARLIALAGRLHDVGKVALPDAVLQKPGRLTAEEWDLIRRHPAIGAEVVGRVPVLRTLAPLIRGHHERWDGGGYPDGLAGSAIPLGARIVAVADAYAAMTSERVYQRGLTRDAALRELRRCAGGQFDPAVVAALERVLAAEHAVSA